MIVERLGMKLKEYQTELISLRKEKGAKLGQDLEDPFELIGKMSLDAASAEVTDQLSVHSLGALFD